MEHRSLANPPDRRTEAAFGKLNYERKGVDWKLVTFAGIAAITLGELAVQPWWGPFWKSVSVLLFQTPDVIR